MAMFKELSFFKTWIKLLVWSSFKTRIVECCIFNADKKSSLLGFQILISRKSLRWKRVSHSSSLQTRTIFII